MHTYTYEKRRRVTPVRLMRARLSAVTMVVTCIVVAAGVFHGSGTQAAPPDQDRSNVEDLQSLIEDVLGSSHPLSARAEDELTFPTLEFFIEFNETDEDIGVQCSLGGEPYRVLKAFSPNDRKILELRPARSLKLQGLSDFFFESAEPTLDEFSMAEFLARFPAGTYEFESITIDGEEQDGEATFTHVIPAGPVILTPQEGDVVDPNDTVIEWEPVTMTTAFNPPQQPVEIVGYQVIVTREDPLRVYSVDVSTDTTSITVPPAFLDAETEYEVEILAIEASDNQTISLLFFETE